ncbi:MAG TPA: PHP domain-containing protein [Candidatus Bilamarchaeum sp.]|nr:PHP domain-containing protein [Candidatus Bilamarchaeum sp.]
MIDLHTHTTASDGTFTFNELVRGAERLKLKALAITDHDTIKSAKRIDRAKSSVELIPGIEITVFDDALGYKDIHVLGLFIDAANAALNSRLEALARERLSQKKATVEKLRELGYSITFEEVKAEAQGSIGRPHIAKVLLRNHPAEFGSISAVFVKLLGRGKDAYVERAEHFPLADAIRTIHGAGGLAILAHPDIYGYAPEKLLSDFKASGGDGVEVYYDYIRNRPEVKLAESGNNRLIERYRSLAAELGLLESGGSDFHGANKGQTLGEFGAPDGILAKLKSAMRKPL